MPWSASRLPTVLHVLSCCVRDLRQAFGQKSGQPDVQSGGRRAHQPESPRPVLEALEWVSDRLLELGKPRARVIVVFGWCFSANDSLLAEDRLPRLHQADGHDISNTYVLVTTGRWSEIYTMHAMLHLVYSVACGMEVREAFTAWALVMKLVWEGYGRGGGTPQVWFEGKLTETITARLQAFSGCSTWVEKMRRENVPGCEGGMGSDLGQPRQSGRIQNAPPSSREDCAICRQHCKYCSVSNHALLLEIRHSTMT